MAEEKKTPAFTEAEEMKIYESFLEKVGEKGVLGNLHDALNVLDQASEEFAYVLIDPTEYSPVEIAEAKEKLLMCVGIMQVSCNMATVAYGDTAEHECKALEILQKRINKSV